MANPNSKPFLLRIILILAAGLWVFAPALQGDWLMDDQMYLTQNALLHDPARLWKIWFSPGSLIEYYPIEASLQAAQWHLWHDDTLGYHLTNIVLHLLSALLIWRLLAKFGLRYAWLGGFLFAVHPAVVESVAWISEFKNALVLPPFLLSMLAWIDFDERGRRRDYFLALAFFVIAMLCKISVAPFPVMILLHAWWKRGRIGLRDIAIVAPFFVVALGLCSMSILADQRYREASMQHVSPVDIGGFASRVVLIGTTIAFYFSKCVWPVGLVPIYPKWAIHPHAVFAYWPWAIMAAVFFWLWQRRAAWGRHALLGLGFFLLFVLPFTGLTSISYMGFTWVMDHFLYLPLIGLIALAMAALEQIEEQLTAPMRPWLLGVVVTALALLAFGSHVYARNFDGPEKLWSYTLAHNPDTWLAYNNLGNVYLETGRQHEAIDAYENALRLNPTSTEANNNLGVALSQLGQTGPAIAHYEQALRINPNDALAHSNLGDLLAKEGRAREAIDHYEQTLRLAPNNRDVRERMGKLEALQNAHP